MSNPEPRPFDPEELARRLDEMLSENTPPLSPDEDVLVETASRMWNAPRPVVDAAAMARIQQQVSDSLPPSPASGNGSAAWNPPTLLITIGIAAVIIAGILVAVSRGTSPAEPTSESTAQVTVEAASTAEATAALTLTVTETAVPTDTPETATASPVPSSTATETPTNTATSTLTPSVVPTATPTPLPVVLVIEGVVESITDTTITIFGVEVQMDPANLVNNAVKVGDMLRIEAGIVDDSTGAAVMTQVTMTFVDVDVYVNPASGEVFRDDSDCSNLPPPWAEATGWRRRCQGAANPDGNNPGNNNNNGNNNGNSNGNSGNAGNNAGGMGMGMGEGSGS